ncbi:ribosomal protein S5 domain 2-type protein [Tricladium varicosporioides]|nr:ribosomal protein S5 domain 2-type protein [Hymenoscyphus varicosporioides]
MDEELRNEVEAINSIYGDNSLVSEDEEGIYVLHLSQQAVSLRLRFPSDYPAAPPSILGSQSSGEYSRKGEAAHVVDVVRDVLGKTFQPGEVCLFDVIEEVNSILPSSIEDCEHPISEGSSLIQKKEDTAYSYALEAKTGKQPPWTLSEDVNVLKSVFIARAAPVSSPEEAKMFLQHLLDSDKKVRSATHNITAWRIKGEGNATYQDCDDDGETAAGGRVLHLMQLMDLWNVMVVVTRWYGGHQLGPKRFSIINTVARDAFVKGGFMKEDIAAKKSKR